MTKFFIIAWFTLAVSGQPDETRYIVNTTLHFNSQINCELFLELESMPLHMGVEQFLNSTYPDKGITINEIGCVDFIKAQELDKIQNIDK